MKERYESPRVVFICGAVGSGNTFMFKSLTTDDQVYGINEDSILGLLGRLLTSEQEMGRCPHSVESFNGFIDLLRKDRQTLVLKTPVNIRRQELATEWVPGSRFIVMVRDPHSAIVSGLSRHGLGVAEVARIWKSDYEHVARMAGDFVIVPYEQLIYRPRATLSAISENLLPLSDQVFQFAERTSDPGRLTPDRWKSKVNDTQREEIEQLVEELGLDGLFDDLLANPRCVSSLDAELTGETRGKRLSKTGLLKQRFFRAWYRWVGRWT